MVRKLVSATASAALCMMSVTPVMAQDYRYTGFDAPRGATATVNLRIPLGAGRQRAMQPTYGFTFGYGQPVGPATVDSLTRIRAVNVADFRFWGGEMHNARVASFDLANLDRDRRMNITGGSKTTLVIVIAAVGLVAVGCVAFFCDGDGDSEPSGNSL